MILPPRPLSRQEFEKRRKPRSRQDLEACLTQKLDEVEQLLQRLRKCGSCRAVGFLL